MDQILKTCWKELTLLLNLIIGTLEHWFVLSFDDDKWEHLIVVVWIWWTKFIISNWTLRRKKGHNKWAAKNITKWLKQVWNSNKKNKHPVLLGPAARTKELKKKMTKDGFFMMGHLGAHIKYKLPFTVNIGRGKENNIASSITKQASDWKYTFLGANKQDTELFGFP